MEGIKTSLDLSTVEGKKLALKALSTADYEAEDIKEVPFPCEAYLIHKVNLVNDETGEVTEQSRVVLISPEGKTVSFVSAGALQSLENILQIFGDVKGLNVKAKEVKTRKGYRTINLIVEM